MKQHREYLRERFVELDRLLRGDATRSAELAGRPLEVSARGLALLAALLAAFYGVCMGSFSLLKETPEGLDDPFGPALQVLASGVKTPALFLLTLVVTLPSLYVSNALIGSRLTLPSMTRLLVASLAVNIAVLASLGTIVLFFSLTTNSYPFVVLLNVAAFGVAGVLGLTFLLQTLHRVLSQDEREELRQDAEGASPAAEGPPVDAPDTEEGGREIAAEANEAAASTGPLEMASGQVLGRHTRLVFRCWIALFSLVGVQMGWVLRPFIGSPDQPFSLFREKGSNFFASVFGAIGKLLFGGF